MLDASALLALLFDEPGAEVVADGIADGAAVSTVNLGEVATVLVRTGREPAAVLAALEAQVAVEPFLERDALAVAELYRETASKGLSLGDRACLALAQRLDAPALTAERGWADVAAGVRILVIPPPRD